MNCYGTIPAQISTSPLRKKFLQRTQSNRVHHRVKQNLLPNTRAPPAPLLPKTPKIQQTQESSPATKTTPATNPPPKRSTHAAPKTHRQLSNQKPPANHIHSTTHPPPPPTAIPKMPLPPNHLSISRYPDPRHACVACEPWHPAFFRAQLVWGRRWRVADAVQCAVTRMRYVSDGRMSQGVRTRGMRRWRCNERRWKARRGETRRDETRREQRAGGRAGGRAQPVSSGSSAAMKECWR